MNHRKVSKIDSWKRYLFHFSEDEGLGKTSTWTGRKQSIDTVEICCVKFHSKLVNNKDILTGNPRHIWSQFPEGRCVPKKLQVKPKIIFGHKNKVFFFHFTVLHFSWKLNFSIYFFQFTINLKLTPKSSTVLDLLHWNIMFLSDFSINHVVKEWHGNLFYPELVFLYNLKYRRSALNLTDLNWSYK